MLGPCVGLNELTLAVLVGGCPVWRPAPCRALRICLIAGLLR